VANLGGIGAAVVRFLRNRSGNFGMMAALTAPLLVLAAGYAVNIVQITITRSNLVAALDSAVTSTARDLTTGAIEEKDARKMVEAFLIANGLRAYAEDGRLELETLVIDRIANTVSAKASVELDVAFALFGTANRQKLTAESAALYSDKKVEVAMMLDVTDSMNGQKIKDLRKAASTAVDIMLASNRPERQRVRIALVPYADAVNAGVLSHTVHVEANTSANQKTYVEPPSLPVNQRVPKTSGSTCASEREGSTTQFTDDGPDVRMVNKDYRVPSCPAAALMPLTADGSKLKTRISNLQISGYTGGPIGIQWTWYLLSPNWAQVLAAEHKPDPYDPKEVAKYAILMTDGEFNVAYAGVSHGSKPRSQETRARSNALKLCENMKKAGVEVFTVGFMLNNTAKNMMKECASTNTGPTKYYHEASTGAELEDAFKAIARNIEKLALTK